MTPSAQGIKTEVLPKLTALEFDSADLLLNYQIAVSPLRFKENKFMPNQGLAFNDSGAGNRGYNGLWIGNVSAPFDNGTDSPSLLREAFYAAQKDEVLPTIVTVASGVPVLSGSLLDEDGVSTPPGVVVTITKPDGTQLNTSSSVYTDDLMIHLDAEGNLSAFMIKNPAPGNWTVSIQVPDGSEPNFQLIVSTLPTGTSDENDMQTTLQSAFQERFTDEQLDGFVTKFALGSRSCFWCKVGAWSIAIAISVILLVVTVAISAETGAIVALAAYVGITAARALLLARVLINVVGKGIGAMVTQICGYMNICAKIGTEAELAEPLPQGGY